MIVFFLVELEGKLWSAVRAGDSSTSSEYDDDHPHKRRKFTMESQFTEQLMFR